MYLFTEGLDKHIYIVSAPVANIGELPSVACIGSLVGDSNARHGVRIEIIVDMQPVDIIAADDIVHYFEDVITVLPQSWVKDFQSIIVKNTLGMGHRHMGNGQLTRIFCLGTIRVNPCVQLHSAAVALVYHPLQWIPIG